MKDLTKDGVLLNRRRVETIHIRTTTDEHAWFRDLADAEDKTAAELFSLMLAAYVPSVPIAERMTALEAAYKTLEARVKRLELEGYELRRKQRDEA